MFEVTYLVHETGERVVKTYYELKAARRLKYKLEHSKRCSLISFMEYSV